MISSESWISLKRHTVNIFFYKIEDNVLPTHEVRTSTGCMLFLPAKNHVGSYYPRHVGRWVEKWQLYLTLHKTDRLHQIGLRPSSAHPNPSWLWAALLCWKGQSFQDSVPECHSSCHLITDIQSSSRKISFKSVMFLSQVLPERKDKQHLLISFYEIGLVCPRTKLTIGISCLTCPRTTGREVEW